MKYAFFCARIFRQAVSESATSLWNLNVLFGPFAEQVAGGGAGRGRVRRWAGGSGGRAFCVVHCL